MSYPHQTRGPSNEIRITKLKEKKSYSPIFLKKKEN
jgi:hypothetical protein